MKNTAVKIDSQIIQSSSSIYFHLWALEPIPGIYRQGWYNLGGEHASTIHKDQPGIETSYKTIFYILESLL